MRRQDQEVAERRLADPAAKAPGSPLLPLPPGGRSDPLVVRRDAPRWPAEAACDSAWACGVPLAIAVEPVEDRRVDLVGRPGDRSRRSPALTGLASSWL